MPIAVNLAKMMGGDIEVKSKLGVGSKFTVYVYLKINKESSDKDEEKADEISEYTKHKYIGKRILLVEDNESNIEIGRELLGIAGITVDVALNGEEAIEKLVENEQDYYDLILMDIQMPVMNGYEATKIIRSMKREDLKKIPIIAMSAYAFTDDIKRAKEVGMNDSISKPIEISKLDKLLSSML